MRFFLNNMYSSRSVDLREFFLILVIFDTPLEPCSENLKNIFSKMSIFWWFSPEILKYLISIENVWIFVIFLQVRHQIGVPYHHGKTEKTSGINRSRGVRTRSAQEHCVTPSMRKVLEVLKFPIFRKKLFFSWHSEELEF